METVLIFDAVRAILDDVGDGEGGVERSLEQRLFRRINTIAKMRIADESDS